MIKENNLPSEVAKALAAFAIIEQTSQVNSAEHAPNIPTIKCTFLPVGVLMCKIKINLLL